MTDERAEELAEDGTRHYDRYVATGDVAELRAAAAAWGRALAEAVDAGHRTELGILHALARAELVVVGGAEDLDDVLGILVAAGSRLDDDDPARVGIALASAQLRLERHRRQHAPGGLEDLDAAVRILASVAAADDVDDQDLGRALAGLTDAHARRYAATGARADLDARIERLRQLRSVPGAVTERAVLDAELGLALADRLAADDAGPAAENEVISLLSAAEPELAGSDPVRPAVRRALGVYLFQRAARGGRPRAELERAITLLDQAFDQAPAGPATAVTAIVLAQALLFRMVPADLVGQAPADVLRSVRNGARPWTGQADDAARAVDLLLGALANESLAAGARAVASAQLAAALVVRGGETMPPSSLPEIAGHLETALADLPVGAPGRVEVLVQAGLVRAQLARLGGNQRDETQLALDLLTSAEHELPPGHPLRPYVERDLGGVLVVTAAWTGRADDIARAARSLRSALETLDPDDETRPDTAGALGTVLLASAAYGSIDGGVDQVIELLGWSLTTPPAAARRHAEFLNAYATALGARFAETGADADGSAAVDAFTAAADLLPAGDDFRFAVLLALASFLSDRYDARRDAQDLDAAIDLLVGLGEQAVRWSAAVAPVLATAGAVVRAMLGSARLQRVRLEPDAAVAAALLDQAKNDLSGAAHSLPAGHPAGPWVRSDLALVRLMRAVETDRGPGLRSAVRELAQAGQDIPAGHPHRGAALGRSGYALAAWSARVGDRRGLDLGIEWLAEALAGMPPADPNTLRGRLVLGSALLERHQQSRYPADLDAAVAALETASTQLAAAGGHPLAPLGAMTLSRALRRRADGRRDDPGRAATAAWEAVRAHARAVLLQTGAERAIGAARRAADDVLWAARWHVADGDPAAAVSVLETGRGLVLHASTVGAGIGGLLADAGRPELAAEWDAAIRAGRRGGWWGPGSDDGAAPVGGRSTPLSVDGLVAADELDLPVDLRHRALAALSGTAAERALLDPPAIGDLAAALTTVGADVLVYLLPAPGPAETDDDRAPGAGGHALVVRPDGTVLDLSLPGLRMQPGGPVDVLGRRGVAAGPEILDRLCEWAWNAAMEQVLAAAAGSAAAGPPRLVLVPVGALGLVPWHAARRPGPPGPDSYACSAAVISTAASGRQLRDIGKRDDLDRSAGMVLVANPDGSLPWAGISGRAVRATVEPDAEYLGRPRVAAAGPGTRAEVLDRLPGGSRPAAVLDLACHAAAGGSPTRSGLALADGVLSVATILEQAQRRATPGGGLVVLSACESDLTLTEYDEALTLATAMLAAGAVGVVGAAWEIGDADAAVLTYVFHWMRRNGLPAADALRAAQLWSLDPDREPPPGMPDGLVRAARKETLAHPASWAAYGHRGR